MAVLYYRRDIKYGITSLLQRLYRFRNFTVRNLVTQPGSRFSIRGTSSDKKPTTKPLDLKWDTESRTFTKPNGDGPTLYQGLGPDFDLDFSVSPNGKRKRKPHLPKLSLVADKAERQKVQDRLTLGYEEGGVAQLYMVLGCVREGELERALDIVKRLEAAHVKRQHASGLGVSEGAGAEFFRLLEMCISALLSAIDPLDLAEMMRVLSECALELPRQSKAPPARCLAYVLHCAYEHPDFEKGNKVAVELCHDWTSVHGRKLAELEQHGDILTEADIQKLRGVSIFD